MSVTLTPKQEQVANAVRNWHSDPFDQTFYLAGYAGTGKTTIIPNILDMCGIAPHQVAFAAPTGKAAQVLTKKLKAFGFPSQAKTIHSWIYTPKRMKEDALVDQLDDLKERLSNGKFPEGVDTVDQMEKLIELAERELSQVYNKKEGPTFNLNLESKIMGARLIVVDEASMVGTQVAGDLKSFGVPILAVGDPMQLQPVKDKRGLAVGDPNAFLDEIHRQAADNPIIYLATQVRQGKTIKHGSYGDGEVRIIKRKDDDVTLNVEREAQVLVGMNKTRYSMTRDIRGALGFHSPTPEKDEALMVVQNSRRTPTLVNGSQVWCDEAPDTLIDGEADFPMRFTDEDGNKYKVNVLQKFFEHHVGKSPSHFSADPYDIKIAQKNGAESVDFGWVITGHKSQGSQWDEVVVHDQSGCFREEADNWLYTCITRAAERLTIVR